MNIESVVESIEVFEWYDGIVLGLVRFGDVQAVAFLLAFDPDRRKRKLCLIPVSESKAENLRDLFSSRGPESLDKSVFSELARSATNAYFTESEPEPGRHLELAVVESADLQRLPIPSFPHIENAISEKAVLEWL